MEQTNAFMETEEIGKLMKRFSIPCIMSLLVAALYNIVDQIFIGWGIGYLGNGATNVVFPITVIGLAFALMIGDGCAAYMSICQGKKDPDGIRHAAGNALLLFMSISILYTVLLMNARDAILQAFGATENNMSYAVEYFDVIVLGMPFFIFSNGLNSMVRADGDPRFAMRSTLIGALINTILDPIAIFVFHMGMQGAALATILGQIVTTLLVLNYLRSPKSFYLNRSAFKPDPSVCKAFLPLGVSSFLTQISIVVIMGVVNNTLVHYGALSRFGSDIPLTVVGIVMKLFQIVISICVGIAVGAQPIVGYNFGAHRLDRVKEVYKKMMHAEILLGIVATLLFELFPTQIISVFGSGDALYNEFAVLAFRIFLCTVLLTCILKSTSIFFQSLGKPVLSMGLSLLRDFILSVPLVLFLPKRFGVIGVLFSAPIADVISFAAVLIFTRTVMSELDEADRATCEIHA